MPTATHDHTECAEFGEWVKNHCYGCGQDIAAPGPEDLDHKLCFLAEEEAGRVRRCTCFGHEHVADSWTPVEGDPQGHGVCLDCGCGE